MMKVLAVPVLLVLACCLDTAAAAAKQQTQEAAGQALDFLYQDANHLHMKDYYSASSTAIGGTSSSNLDPALFEVDDDLLRELQQGQGSDKNPAQVLHPEQLHLRHLQRDIAHEYNASCTNPDLLYAGLDNHFGHECKCEPDRFDGFHRIVCQLQGLDCTTFSACVGQYDVWIFQEGSGQLVTRSTCLPCQDSTTNCLLWRNMCISADFGHDSNDMEDCIVIMSESSPPLVCETCNPCITSDNTWGMEFECFDIATDGCTDGARIGLHPFDGDGPTPGVGTGSSSNETPDDNGGDSSSSAQKSATSDDNDDTVIMVVAIAASVNALLLCAVLFAMVYCIRQRKKQANVGATEGVFKADDNAGATPEELDLTMEEDTTESTPSPPSTPSPLSTPAPYLNSQGDITVEPLPVEDHQIE